MTVQLGSLSPVGQLLPTGQSASWRVVRVPKVAGAHVVNRELTLELPAYTATALQEYRDGAWHDWMTDDPVYYDAMQYYAQRAAGTVLVLGLGLGIVLYHLRQNPDVRSIVVVEREQNVVDLIWPTIVDDRVDLVIGDFFGVLDDLPKAVDTIIADLWVGSPPTFIDLFLRTYDTVREYWPGAKAFYHGVDPWAKVLDDGLSVERTGVLRVMAESWSA